MKQASTTMIGAVSIPYIVPASVFGAKAPSNKIVMGCIGMGGRGQSIMKNFMNEPDTQIVAVCDVNTKHYGTARDYANKTYGNKDCATYGDFRKMLADQKLDAVTICTPDHWHGLISIAAAKAGCDIYCEKPLTNTIAEGRAVFDTVRRYGRILQTGSHERSRQKARFACELVRNGRVGKVHTIQVNLPCTEKHHLDIINDKEKHPIVPVPEGFDYDFWLGHTPWEPYTPKRCTFLWRFIMNYGGGEMTDRGAHVIDLAQLGNGTDDTTPIELEAKGERTQSSLFNTFFNFTFKCKYANGVQMIGTSDGPRGVKFIGDKGWIFIHVHGGHLKAEPKSLLKEKIGHEEIQLGRSPGHQRNFLDCVKTRQKPFASVEVGHHTAVICHLLNISMQVERKIKWDPRREQIIGDTEANSMLARPMRSPWRL
ncbi:MAG: Gfo/Idh/MocA family oxidoreductase [Sedimentisphaerales bacterium]|nr:Gfo/Idh/MocA family oxidoreductase [Sedimentisphaerales bacterium]